MSDFVPASSLRNDGKRNFVHPADVKGRWTLRRRLLFVVLIAVYVSLPLIDINGHPAVFLDIVRREFYLFGATFNAQDIWLMFFLLSGAAFSLLFLTALAGRVWCGYACPQTVFLDGVYRRIERWIEGPRAARLRLSRQTWGWSKLWRKLLKHSLYLVVTLLIVHVFLGYFVSMPSLLEMIQRSPSEHPTAFGFMIITSAMVHFNFVWFREQTCLIVCPYGRLQSVLTDSDSLIIGYDEGRGEPRGKVSNAGAGDCIDCKRCVAVCPTGIDIRNGLQIDCIGCAACIDACDEMMVKVGRDPGLIRYDSLNGLAGKKRRIFRGRIAFYLLLGVAGLIATVFAARAHAPYEANLSRQRGLPYVCEKTHIRNHFELHLVNKTDERVTYRLMPVSGDSPIEYSLRKEVVELDGMRSERIQVVASVQQAKMRRHLSARIRIVPDNGDPPQVVSAPFLGPM